MDHTPATSPSVERERKYLVHGRPWEQEPWIRDLRSDHLLQGYLNLDPDRTVRVRVRGDEAWLTVKGRTQGDTRVEYEYAVPRGDADHLLALSDGHPVEKVRHSIAVPPHVWEVDEFLGENAGLVVAECEFPGGEAAWPPPEPAFVAAWVGTLDAALQRRFLNASLAGEPYPVWRHELDAVIVQSR